MTAPQDWTAALEQYWGNMDALAPLSPSLYFSKAPPGQPIWSPPKASDPSGFYPYASFTMVGSKTDGHNTGTGFWDDTHWQFNFYHPNMDVAVSNALIARPYLDSLNWQPLVFADGYQQRIYRTGQMLAEVPGTGPYTNLYVWRQSYVYRVNVGQNKPW